MTLQEFRAWLDGYSEHIEAAPTPEQWAKIREKLETVEEADARRPTVFDPGFVTGEPMPWWQGPVTCGAEKLRVFGDPRTAVSISAFEEPPGCIVQSWN